MSFDSGGLNNLPQATPPSSQSTPLASSPYFKPPTPTNETAKSTLSETDENDLKESLQLQRKEWAKNDGDAKTFYWTILNNQQIALIAKCVPVTVDELKELKNLSTEKLR